MVAVGQQQQQQHATDAFTSVNAAGSRIGTHLETRPSCQFQQEQVQCKSHLTSQLPNRLKYVSLVSIGTADATGKVAPVLNVETLE
jgi:hypothetical protein